MPLGDQSLKVVIVGLRRYASVKTFLKHELRGFYVL